MLQYLNSNHTLVDIPELDHPNFKQPIRLIASPDDPPTAKYFAKAVAGDYGPIAPYVQPEVDMAALQAQALQRVVAFADGVARQVTAAYPEAERAAWTEKKVEAEALLAAAEPLETAKGLPLLGAMIEALELDADAAKAEAQKVLTNAARFQGIAAWVEILRRQAEQQIAAAQTPAELETLLETLQAEAAAKAAAFGLSVSEV